MPPSTYASGTQTATLTTEHFVSSPNVAGGFQFEVNLDNMVDGDVVILRAYRITISGGSAEVLYQVMYDGAQPAGDVPKESPIIANSLTDTNSLRFSIQQTDGAAGRSFPWIVRQF